MKKNATIKRKFYQKEFVSSNVGILLDFLLKTFNDRSRNEVKSYLSHRQILVNGKCCTSFDTPLRKGDKVTFLSIGQDKPNPNHKYRVVYEDDNVVVVDKKYGVSTINKGKDIEKSIFYILDLSLKQRDPQSELFVVHRLDRDSSGLILFAKNEYSQKSLKDNIQNRQIKQKYVAVVEGNMETEKGEIKNFLKENKKSLKTHISASDDGMQAITNYKVIKSGNHYCLIEIEPLTDVKHQIRSHFSSIGHSIAGDKKYGATSNPLKRICIHSLQISFICPQTRKKIEVRTDIPKEFL